MKITASQPLTNEAAEHAYSVYEPTMRPLAYLAAQRHVMNYGEFFTHVTDPRVTVYQAHSDDGDLIGIGTIGNDLDAFPLVSPEYFAAKFPEQVKQGRLWYIGFAIAVPRPESVYLPLIGEMSKPMRDAGGIAVMDFCSYNTIRRRMPSVTGLLLGRLGPVGATRLDSQEFWAYDFTSDAVPVSDHERRS